MDEDVNRSADTAVAAILHARADYAARVEAIRAMHTQRMSAWQISDALRSRLLQAGVPEKELRGLGVSKHRIRQIVET